jgi:protein-disulfide isomerase/uncharacterized membrane protein
MFLAGCAGMIVAAYLAVTYLSAAPIACGPLHGCDIVRSSHWAKWFGIPTPLFGLAFYAAILALLVVRTALPRWKRILAYRLTRIMAVLGFFESVFLFFIQLLDLKAFCTWCLGSAIAASAIFILSWFDGHPETDPARETKELRFQFISIAVALVLGGGVIARLTIPHTNGTPPVIAPASADAEDAALKILYRDGLSFEGPADAPVTLIEFADYECPACRQAYAEVKKVLEKYSDKIRFAYRQFPLPIHKSAKGAAVAAVCADHQGRLFPYSDLLFTGADPKLTRDDVVHDAADLRLDLGVFVPCLDATSARESVARDVVDGDALGVTETPTFFVNGMMIDGLPNAEQLGAIIEQELSRKS